MRVLEVFFYCYAVLGFFWAGAATVIAVFTRSIPLAVAFTVVAAAGLLLAAVAMREARGTRRDRRAWETRVTRGWQRS